MSKLEVCVPVPTLRSQPHRELARRTPLPDAPRLLLLDNGKPRGRQLLELVAGHLVRGWLPGATVTVRAKVSAGRVIDTDEAMAIARAADLVLAGVGDCGACSTSTVSDAAELERLGVPSAVIITDAFEGLISTYLATLGLDDLVPVVAPHPVVSISEDALEALSVRLAADAADRLGLTGAEARLVRVAS